ncbi:proprotein convertase subtilisin/kexin type 9-like [Ptychodera flava]|uniref:proprotein convertase subtilisin/kexin type 9-like n=1 Tax=Ptychodera flava TaxID=63121 RepID=UPI00396A1577
MKSFLLLALFLMERMSVTVEGQRPESPISPIDEVNLNVLELTDSVDAIREDLRSFKKEILYKVESKCGDGTVGQQPVCVTRIGPLSGSRDDQPSEVSCLADEVMTGCSSYMPGAAHGTRDGERMRFTDDGQATCVAYNGAGGTGVRPYARCCKWQDMVCYYPEGNPSASNDDAISKSVCDHWFYGNPTLPTGCLVYTPWQCIDGARPASDFAQDMTSEQRPLTERACLGQNGGCRSVTSTAACCSAPNLECQVKYSEPSDRRESDQARVTCDRGWTLTGCNVFTYWKNTDGAFIADDDVCIAVGNSVVWAVATCCRSILPE